MITNEKKRIYQNKQKSSKWLTVREVAQHFGVTAAFVRQRAASGLWPSFNLGERLLKFRAEDIESFAKPVVVAPKVAATPEVAA
jgi:hypothetical protein